MTNATALLGLVGDVMVNREKPASVFASAAKLLAAPDLVFANLEGTYTDHPHPAPSLRTPLFPAAHNLDVFARAGFDVMSLANNHTCAAGHEALEVIGATTCGRTT